MLTNQDPSGWGLTAPGLKQSYSRRPELRPSTTCCGLVSPKGPPGDQGGLRQPLLLALLLTAGVLTSPAGGTGGRSGWEHPREKPRCSDGARGPAGLLAARPT